MKQILNGVILLFVTLNFVGCAEKYIPTKEVLKNGATLILPADRKNMRLKFAISNERGCAKTIYLNEATYKNGAMEMITKIPNEKVTYLWLNAADGNYICNIFSWFKPKKGFTYKVESFGNGYKCGLYLLENKSDGKYSPIVLGNAKQNPVTSEICKVKK